MEKILNVFKILNTKTRLILLMEKTSPTDRKRHTLLRVYEPVKDILSLFFHTKCRLERLQEALRSPL